MKNKKYILIKIITLTFIRINNIFVLKKAFANNKKKGVNKLPLVVCNLLIFNRGQKLQIVRNLFVKELRNLKIN